MIKIKAFNIKEAQELEVKVGIIEKIIDSENSKKLVLSTQKIIL